MTARDALTIKVFEQGDGVLAGDARQVFEGGDVETGSVSRLIHEERLPQGFEGGAVKDQFADTGEITALDEQLGEALDAGRVDAELGGDLRDGLLESEGLEGCLGEEAREGVACRLLLGREGDPVSGEPEEVLLGNDLLPIDQGLQNGPRDFEG